MANRKWTFGCLCLVVGFVVGHLGTRAASSTGQAAPGEAGISLAISAPPPPAKGPSKLNLTDVTFCHKISSFGNYATYTQDEFAPDQAVLIYAGIEDLESEQMPDGNFRTVAKSTIELYRAGEAQELVERIDVPEAVDVCRRRRLDYFHSYQLTMPETLAEGDYILKLTVKDQLSNREGTSLLAFSIK
ncbi:MAG TPA: hypothetical protein VGH74_02450 [Planctomycetaceae bacterium]|jgi:hypothetical protein